MKGKVGDREVSALIITGRLQKNKVVYLQGKELGEENTEVIKPVESLGSFELDVLLML